MIILSKFFFTISKTTRYKETFLNFCYSVLMKNGKKKERNLSLHMGEVGGNIITVNSALKLRRKHRVTSEIKFLDN